VAPAAFLLDAIYLASPALMFLNPDLAPLFLIGIVGVITLLVQQFQRMAFEQPRASAWWFVPGLLLPWTTQQRMSRGAREAPGGSGKAFRFGASAFLVVLALFFATQAHRPILDPALAPLTTYGADYITTTQTKTGVAFALARSLNAALSTITSIEASAAVASVDVGAVAEPVDDLVERFSWVMLAAFGAVTALQMLGEMGKVVGLGVLLPVGLGLLIASLWLGGLRRSLQWLGVRFLVVGLVVRFVVPVTGLVIYGADHLFLEERAQTAQDKIPGSGEKAAALPSTAEGSGGWFNFGVVEKVSAYKEQMRQFAAKADAIAQGLVQLLVIFLLRTIVLPLLTLWGFVRLMRWLLDRPDSLQRQERTF